MLAWWLSGGLAVGLLVALFHLRMVQRDRAAVQAELAQARAAQREANNQQIGLFGTQFLIEAALDAVIFVDSKQQVVALNQAARELFAGRGDPHGQTLIALTRNHEIDDQVKAALSGGDDLDRQITIDDRPFRARALAAPGASAEWAAVTLRDVSELLRLSRARRDMVANISHELRNPITSIRLLVETLMGGALTHKKRGPKLLDKIAAETSILQQMAQELLDLSMIESGEAIMRLVPVSADDLLREAVDHMSEQAGRKEQELVQVPCQGVMVLADSEMVLRVLTNLLHNAIKFAPEGGHVGVACEVTGEWARVSVTDDGPGIPFADHERVFERFYRADRARGGAGTGLGLAIAKHIVEAHGGQIWVAERDIGQPGAQLVFTLPLADKETAPSGVSSVAES
jgi:two-component system phosphate regulon sensor histidine kinase PhoR